MPGKYGVSGAFTHLPGIRRHLEWFPYRTFVLAIGHRRLNERK